MALCTRISVVLVASCLTATRGDGAIAPVRIDLTQGAGLHFDQRDKRVYTLCPPCTASRSRHGEPDVHTNEDVNDKRGRARGCPTV